MVSKVFLFPLPNTMSLHKVVMPYHIFEPRYRAMVHEALATQTPIAVVPFRPDGNYTSMACYAGVPQILHKYEDGRMDISLSGEVRCRVKTFLSENPYLVFSCEEEGERLSFSPAGRFSFECLTEAMEGWLLQNLKQSDQRAAFRSLMQDKEALLSYATLFLIKDNAVRMEVVEEPRGDARAGLIVKALGPKEVSLGPFLPPMRWKT